MARLVFLAIFGIFFINRPIVDGRHIIIYPRNDIGKFCSNFGGGIANLTYGAKSTIKFTAENLPINMLPSCQFEVIVPKGFGVNVRVESNKFKDWKTRSQCINFLTIRKYSERSRYAISETLCEKYYDINYVTSTYNTFSTRGVMLEFDTALLKQAIGTSWLYIYITAYTKNCNSFSDLFQCSNYHCIFDDLVCNEIDDCGDNSDESYDACDVDVLSNHTKILLYCLMPVIFVIALCLCIVRLCCRGNGTVVHRRLVVLRRDDQPPPYSVIPNQPENSANIRIQKPIQLSKNSRTVEETIQKY